MSGPGGQSRTSAPVVIAAALLLLAGTAGGADEARMSPAAASGDEEGFSNRLELGPDAPEMGSPKAPIVVVEVVDFRCPYCAEQATTTLEAIVERYVDPGLVRYVVLDFPLPYHAEAERDAVAARCAGEQGMYWLAHRALLADPALARDGALDLGAFAALLGLDGEALAECVDSGRQVAAVRDGARRAMAVRVDGTPTFLFGFPREDEPRVLDIERHLEGAVGLEPVVAAIEALRESLRQRAVRQVVDH